MKRKNNIKFPKLLNITKFVNRLVEKIYKKLFSLPQVTPIFSLIETCMIKLMGLQWVCLWYLFSPIFLWDIVKKSRLGITIMERCFIIKGMPMIYLQFLKLKIMLFHFTIISIGNTGI